MNIKVLFKTVFGGADTDQAPVNETVQETISTKTSEEKEMDSEKDSQDNQTALVYNLIILDESGSMSGVTG